MSPVHHEQVFEAAIVSSLVEPGGWRQGDAREYDRDLGLNPVELIEFVKSTQPKEWGRLKQLHADDEAAAARRLAEVVAKHIDERGALEVLRHGLKDRAISFKFAYFRPAHTIAADALVPYGKNILSVVRQIRYSVKTTDELDLALFVNGVPVATAELKNQATGTTVEDAKEQYRKDRDPRELIFAKRTLVHFAVDQDLVFITTRLAGAKTRFLPFNMGSEGAGDPGGAGNPDPAAGTAYRTSYLWERIWQRDTWLDLIKRFLHLEDEEVNKGRGRKPSPGKAHRLPLIFPRYHQWDTVLKAAGHAAQHGAGHNYLVQHSAGSGKSNTIAWLAHRLSNLHTPADAAELDPGAVKKGLGPNKPVFDKVIIITDRVVLDRQLQETVTQFEHTPGVVKRIDLHSAQLADALQGETVKIVITTLQKFPYVLQQVDGLKGKRFAVIADEAHSSQSGESAAALKRVLLKLGTDDIDEDGNLLTASALARGKHETLSFFAFTATPKPKTLHLFGTPGQDGKPRPFHIYSMKQAIEEGFILDVLKNYVTYKTYWRLANANPHDREVERTKANAKLARFAELHPTSMSHRAEIIVEHFRSHTAGRLGKRAKAMVVTRSREHALRLGQAIRDYVQTNGYPNCGTLIAFSGSLTQQDADGNEIEYTEARMNGFGPNELPDRFAYCKADDRHSEGKQEFRILVVADKYQTGFDQPLLTTMYVDKKLAGVAAVQTLSRLNRTHPLKSQGDVYVLDFANEAEEIQAAFQPYFESTTTDQIDPNLLYTKEGEVMHYGLLVTSEMQALAEAYLAGERAAATHEEWVKAHAALYRFTDPARQRFEELRENDSETAEEFRGALNDYVRLYGFMAQVVPYHDEDLERLYIFGRFLLNRLPKPEDPSVDIGQIDLTHLRIDKTGDHDISLSDEGEVSLPGPSDGGSSPVEQEIASLAQLIAAFNDKYGLGLSETDQIWIEQQFKAAAEDESLQLKAMVNDEANFGEAFGDHLQKAVIRQHEDNSTLMQRYFDDSLFRSRINELGRSQVYRIIRESGGLD
ncbi:type I restriction endonuclease [Spirillospora sp. NPDC047418]